MIKNGSLLALLSITSSLLAEPLNLLEKDSGEGTPESFRLENEIKAEQAITVQSPPVFESRSPKNSFFAVGLSCLVPGLGHAYLGDMTTAGCLAGTFGLGMSADSLVKSDDFIRNAGGQTAVTAWCYGIYASYRDVRKYNGQVGYSYQMPIDSFADLVYAPFNFSVIKKPEVWGGLLGNLALASLLGYFALTSEKQVLPPLSFRKTLQPLMAFPVGIGEESLCRGFLQSQFSEWLTPWGGIVLSSLIFGALHIPNAQDMEPQERRGYYTYIVPFITLSGMYDGWLAYKNHSLKECVAEHAWYDFVVFSIGAIATQSAVRGRADFAIAIPF